MIDASLESTLRDGEVDAWIVHHPLCVVALLDGRWSAEYGGVKTNVSGQVVNGNVDVKALHDLLLIGLRLRGAAQQVPSAVSMTVRHSCGIPWQQFSVRKVISAAICSKSAL